MKLEEVPTEQRFAGGGAEVRVVLFADPQTAVVFGVVAAKQRVDVPPFNPLHAHIQGQVPAGAEACH